RALELLAASPDGCTEALMFANGFTAELLLELVRAGLASAHAERVVADGRMMEAARLKISEAGWQAVAGDADGRTKSTCNAANHHDSAGFVLQIDDPGLPDWWDMIKPEPAVEEYRKFAKLRIEAVNHALVGIPEEKVRYHLCWGSWHGAHTHDLPL